MWNRQTNPAFGQHFLKEVGCPSNSAKCKTCGTVISTIGGTTSGLRKHVTNVHKGTVLDKQKPMAASQLQVFQRATVESAMSSMAALDGISFFTIGRSKDIRLGLAYFNNISRRFFSGIGTVIPGSGIGFPILVPRTGSEEKTVLCNPYSTATGLLCPGDFSRGGGRY